MKERFGRFALEVHPDKTRLIEFGPQKDRRQRGQGRPETFDFLGLTHYCAKDRRGRFQLGRKPVAKRMNRTLKRLKEELRRRMHHDVADTAKWLGRVVNGWLNYYAVQLPISIPIRRASKAAVAQDSTPSLAKGPLQVGQTPDPYGYPLAQAGNQTSVAEPTICRQRLLQRNPREEPDALAGTSGTAPPGNRRPYRY